MVVRSLGVPANSYGVLLSSVLLNQLPPGLHLIISGKISYKEWSFELLLTAVEEDIQVRERTSLKPSAQVKKPRDTPMAAALLSRKFWHWTHFFVLSPDSPLSFLQDGSTSKACPQKDRKMFCLSCSCVFVLMFSSKSSPGMYRYILPYPL